MLFKVKNPLKIERITTREKVGTKFDLQVHQTPASKYWHTLTWQKQQWVFLSLNIHIPMRFSASPTGCNIADSPWKKATKIWNLLSHPFDPRQHCSFGSGVFEVCTWQSHLHLMSFRLLPFCCAKHLSQLSLIWWGHAVTPDPLGSKWNHLTKKVSGVSLLPVRGHLIFADVQQILQMTLLPS